MNPESFRDIENMENTPPDNSSLIDEETSSNDMDNITIVQSESISSSQNSSEEVLTEYSTDNIICVSDTDSNYQMQDSIVDDSTQSFNTDSLQGNREMFAASQLKVSDVLLMIESFSTSKNLTRTDHENLINLIKVLAGPEFEHWNPTQYKLSQIYDAPLDLIILHFFCEKCNLILTRKHLNKSSKKETFRCYICKKKKICSFIA